MNVSVSQEQETIEFRCEENVCLALPTKRQGYCV
jgi:hypothetical protein